MYIYKVDHSNSCIQWVILELSVEVLDVVLVLYGYLDSFGHR